MFPSIIVSDKLNYVFCVEQLLIPITPLVEQHRILAKLAVLMQICDELEVRIHESKGQNEQFLHQVLREPIERKQFL